MAALMRECVPGAALPGMTRIGLERQTCMYQRMK